METILEEGADTTVAARQGAIALWNPTAADHVRDPLRRLAGAAHRGRLQGRHRRLSTRLSSSARTGRRVDIPYFTCA